MNEKNFWKIFPVNRDSADAEPMHPEDHAALLAWVRAKVKENRHSLS
jgi:hypothetical protein